MICRRLLARGEQDICPDCFESLPNFEGEKPQVGGADGLSVTLFYEGAVREARGFTSRMNTMPSLTAN